MRSFFFLAKAYISYLVKRKDEHSLHSPFLFDFYTKAVKQKKNYLSARLEKERTLLLQDKREIASTDLGAGSGNASRQVSQIAKGSLSPSQQAAFLGAMVNYLKPKTIIEIGTSFGLTTSYLAEYANGAPIYTLEGNGGIARLAQERFGRLGFQNITLVEGNFDDTLAEVLAKVPIVDFVFFDGNHRYKPTMAYFGQCLAKTDEQSVFVFHDIYWSGEMARAWREICAHPSVMLSVDLYFFGLVFFRQNQPKQHFVLRF